MSATTPRDPRHQTLRALLVTSAGLGFLRPFPGTWGSMPTAALAWALLLLGASSFTYHMALLIVLAISCIICVALGPWAEQRFGKKDASQIVIDETAGQCIPLFLLPQADPLLLRNAHAPITTPEFWRITLTIAAAFVLFRIMDIIKPPPANALQRLKHGWGVLIDDLFAGLYAAIVLHAGIWALRLL